MDESENKNMEVDRLHLIDFSSEDDFLIASPSGSNLGDLQASGFPKEQKEHNSFESFVAGNTRGKKDSVDILEQREQVAQLFDSHEPERTRKTGKCNLRKSLAWDSAFFTSAGVLEPEELTIINNGFQKVDLHFLPGIEEDIRSSAESNSTLDSDSLTLESLEVDLFEDVRASIQRSSKTFNVACSTSKSGLGKKSTENIHTSKKPDTASQDRAKPVYASKRQIFSVQGTEKMKEASVRQRPVQPAARSGVPNSSSLKPPKISSRANPITTEPTKRASLGARRVKMENTTANTASGTAGLASKKPRSGYTCTVTPKSSSSSRSSSGSPIAAKMESTVSCSSNNSSGRASSDSTCKSPLSSTKRKVDSRNVNLASPVSTIQTPLRTSSRSKTDSGNYCLSTYLTSMSKLPSSISPASSIDGWSSESSSSTSTINQRSNRSKSSLDTSSSSVISSVPRNHHQDQPCDGPEHKGTGLPSQHVKKGLMETGTFSNRASTNVSRSFKPSGLRMPSPKIGFFDAEKHVVRTPNGNLQLQPGVRSGLHKIGGGVGNVNGGISYKTKPGKLQPERTVIGIGNQHPASSMRSISLLAQLQEPSDASAVVFGSETTEIFPTISMNAENKLSSEPRKDSHLKTREEEVEGFDVANHGMGSSDHGDLMKKVSPTEDRLDFCWDASFSIICESLKPSKKGIKEVIYGKQSDDDTQDNLHSVESTEKENLYHFKEQVDGLSSQVDAMDLNRNPLKELVQMKGPSFSHFGANEADSDDRESSCSNEFLVLLHGPKEDFLKVLSRPAAPLSPSPTYAQHKDSSSS